MLHVRRTPPESIYYLMNSLENMRSSIKSLKHGAMKIKFKASRRTFSLGILNCEVESISHLRYKQNTLC